MPSIVSGFEYDIFISYRHNDNRSGASTGSGQGWVTEFVTALQEEVAATMKAPVTIYFDKNPHDGLQQHHEVDDSLREKLKCLVFIPIVSQTYCDPKAFAWAHELAPFIQQATNDSLGLKTKVAGGNIASRVLPVKIHDIDSRDKALFEEATGSVLRSIDFIYKESGVNRPLRPNDDRQQNEQRTDYRNQVNKVANAIKEIISGLQPEVGDFAPDEVIRAASGPVLASKVSKPKKQWRFNTGNAQSLSRFNLPFIGALLALIVLAYIHFSEIHHSPTYKTTILPPDKTQFNNDFGSNIALSPDGTMIAFSAIDSSGKSMLYVRHLNVMEARALKGTEEAKRPFWSADNRFLGFFVGDKLKKVDLAGGPAHTLCTANLNRGGSWNQDGVVIFSTNETNAIHRVAASGGTSVQVTRLDSTRKEASHRWPVFLPDGEHFLFTSRVNTIGAHPDDAIFVASLDSSFTPKMIVKASSSLAYANGHLIYYKEETLVAQLFDSESLEIIGDPVPIADQIGFEAVNSNAAFSVSQNGLLAYQSELSHADRTDFVWYDRNGKSLGGFSHSSLHNNLKLSRDGKSVAVKEWNLKKDRQDIWLYEFSRNAWTRFTTKGRNFWPTWSPDSRMIAYASYTKNSSGKSPIYLREASGADSEKSIFESSENSYPTDWSRDGKFVAFSMKNDIWILPMNASGDKPGGPPFPFLQTEFQEFGAVFSPDGRWIAYASSESGKGEIYIRPFPGPGRKWQVSTTGGYNARWRSDGKELFFVSSSTDGLMSVEIKSGDATLGVGAERMLFTLPNEWSGGYDVTSDGQRFLCSKQEANDSPMPVTLVVNWLEELKGNK